jgi:hypothetical protein
MKDLAVITDICQRVLGSKVRVESKQDAQHVWQVRAMGAKAVDPLTRSQQEMDIIMSLQHGLAGAAIKLVILE